MTASPIEVTSLLVSLLALWVLHVFFWRDYEVDKARQRYFALRERLFDLAADGQISFDHPAYGTLRTMINGHIRYAHRTGILFLLFSAPVVRDQVAERIVKRFEKRWRNALDELSPDTRAAVEAIHRDLHRRTIVHILWMSPLLVIVGLAILLPILGAAALKQLASGISRSLGRRMGRATRKRVQELWGTADGVAFELGAPFAPGC